VECPLGSSTIQYMLQGSNLWYLKLQVRNTRVPVYQVILTQASNGIQVTSNLARTSDNFFTSSGLSSVVFPLTSPLQLQIVAVNGESITDSVSILDPSGNVINSQVLGSSIQFGSTTGTTQATLTVSGSNSPNSTVVGNAVMQQTGANSSQVAVSTSNTSSKRKVFAVYDIIVSITTDSASPIADPTFVQQLLSNPSPNTPLNYALSSEGLQLQHVSVIRVVAPGQTGVQAIPPAVTGLSAGAIAGIVLGSACVLAVAAAAVIISKMRQQLHREDCVEMEDPQFSSTLPPKHPRKGIDIYLLKRGDSSRKPVSITARQAPGYY